MKDKYNILIIITSILIISVSYNFAKENKTETWFFLPRFAEISKEDFLSMEHEKLAEFSAMMHEGTIQSRPILIENNNSMLLIVSILCGYILMLTVFLVYKLNKISNKKINATT